MIIWKLTRRTENYRKPWNEMKCLYVRQEVYYMKNRINEIEYDNVENDDDKEVSYEFGDELRKTVESEPGGSGLNTLELTGRQQNNSSFVIRGSMYRENPCDIYTCFYGYSYQRFLDDKIS